MKTRFKALLWTIAIALLAWGAVGLWAAQRASATRHVYAGIRYAQVGIGRRAESEWLAALKADPKNAAAWELLGEMYLAENRWNEAGKAFDQVRRIKPNTPKINCRLAGCALRLGMDNAALQYAQEEL